MKLLLIVVSVFVCSLSSYANSNTFDLTLVEGDKITIRTKSVINLPRNNDYNLDCYPYNSVAFSIKKASYNRHIGQGKEYTLELTKIGLGVTFSNLRKDSVLESLKVDFTNELSDVEKQINKCPYFKFIRFEPSGPDTNPEVE